MTTEPQGEAAPVNAEDTAAVLAAANPEALLESPKAPAAEDAPGGSDPAPEPQAEGEQPKPKKTAQERIDELTWRANEAERREQAARDEVAALKAKTPAQEAQPKPEDGDGRPDPGQFEFGVTDEAYIEALADWKAGKKVDERFAERDAQTEVVQTIEGFKSRAAQAFPEGEPAGLAAYRAVKQVPPALQDIVLRTADGPKIADHYGNNPADLQRLMDMPPHLQAFEIGQVQARLSSPAAKPTKLASDAPDPPSHQSRGTGGQFKPAADTDDFASFEKAYLK